MEVVGAVGKIVSRMLGEVAKVDEKSCVGDLEEVFPGVGTLLPKVWPYSLGDGVERGGLDVVWDHALAFGQRFRVRLMPGRI